MRRFITTALLGVAILVVGCEGGRPPRDIPVSASNDPLEPARVALRRYAEGQPVASEVTSFPHMVSEVKKVDAVRGEILEKGLEDIQKNPGQAQAKARVLLEKLAPSMK